MFQEDPAATGLCGHVETSAALSSYVAGRPKPYRLHTTAVKCYPTCATHPFSNTRYKGMNSVLPHPGCCYTPCASASNKVFCFRVDLNS